MLSRAAKAVRLRTRARRRTLMRGILGAVYDATTRHSGACHEPSASLLRRKVVKLAIEEVRRPHFGERARDGFDAPGVAFFPLAQHLGYNLPLQVLLGAAQGAWNDRKRLLSGVHRQVFLGDVGKRA